MSSQKDPIAAAAGNSLFKTVPILFYRGYGTVAAIQPVVSIRLPVLPANRSGLHHVPRLSTSAIAHTEANASVLPTAGKSAAGQSNESQAFGASPAALQGYRDLLRLSTSGQLSRQLCDGIAMVVADFNDCAHSLAMHSHQGNQDTHIRQDDIDAVLCKRTFDPKVAAGLRFARQVAESRGHVATSDIVALRAAGFNEPSIIEIVVAVGLNVLENYVNNMPTTPSATPDRAKRKVGRPSIHEHYKSASSPVGAIHHRKNVQETGQPKY